MKMLICKGADSVIEKLLKKGQDKILEKTDEYCRSYAQEGLRTLYLAMREIPENEYQQWNKKSEKAKLALKNREEEVAKVDAEIE